MYKFLLIMSIIWVVLAIMALMFGWASNVKFVLGILGFVITYGLAKEV